MSHPSFLRFLFLCLLLAAGSFFPTQWQGSDPAFTSRMETGANRSGLAKMIPLPWKEDSNGGLYDYGTVTVDHVTATNANGSYGAGVTIFIQVVFTDIVTVTGTPQLVVVTNDPPTTAVNYTGGSGTNTLTFEYTIAALNISSDLDYDGTGALQLNGGTIVDASLLDVNLPLPPYGSGNSLRDRKDIAVDTASPSVVFDLRHTSDLGWYSDDDKTNATSLVFDAAFAEPVSGFDGTDLTNGGTAGPCNFSVGTASGNTYPVTVTGCTQGTLILDLAADKVTDSAGNGNEATFGPTITIDRTGPTPNLTSSDPLTTNAPISIMVTYPEGVANFVAEDVATDFGLVSNFNPISPTTYSFTLTSTHQGSFSAHVPAGVADDIYGNGNLLSNTITHTFDSIVPTVTFDLQDSSDTGSNNSDNLTNANPLVFNASFSEQVNGFVDTDLSKTGTATGCTMSVGTATLNVYPVTVSGCTDGTLTLHLAADKVTDNAGNGNVLTDGPTVTIDRVGPTTNLTSTSLPSVNAPISITVTFSDSVTNFVVGDISTGNGSASNLSPLSGPDYTFTLTPSSQGIFSAYVPAGAGQDVYGNGNQLSNTLSRTFDSVGPTVTFDLRPTYDLGWNSEDDKTNAGTLVFDAAFSEVVSGFDGTDLSNNGGASSCGFSVGAPSGNTYPVTVTGCTDGTLILHLAADKVTDSAGNAVAATNGPTVTIDRTGPTTNLTSTAPDPTSNPAISVSVSFSEAVTNFIAGDILMTNGAVSNFSGTGPNYSYTLTALAPGLFDTHIPVGAGQDVYGNDNQLSNTISRTYDSSLPTVTFDLQSASDSGWYPDDDKTNLNTLVFNAIFSETVNGFANEDLSNAGTAGSCAFSVGPVNITTYPVTVTGCTDGTLILHLPAGSVTDGAGNGNASTNGPTVVIDRTGPTANLTSSAPLNTNAPVAIIASFSEAVTGFELLDIATLNGNASGLSGGGSSYTFTLTAIAQGAFNAHIPIGAGQDVYGNGNQLSNTLSYTYDSIRPGVSIDSTTPDPTNISTFQVTITFSEPVTGLVLTEINVSTHGKAENLFSSDGRIYTFDLTINGQFTVTVDIAEGVAQDAAGNTNTAAPQFSRTHDTSAATVTLDLQDASDTGTSSTDNNTNADTLVFNAAFTEPVSGFAAGDLSTVGTVTGCSIVVELASGNTYMVTLSTCSAGTFNLRLGDGLVTDLAGNPIAQTDSPLITVDRTAPTVTFDLLTGSDLGPLNTDNITNATSPIFNAIFDEAISGFESTDLSNIGTAACSGFSLGTQSGNTYPVTANSCGVGSLIPQLAAGSLTDIAGNPNAQTDGLTITIERTLPTVTFDLLAGSDTGTSDADNLTNAASPVFAMNFSEAVYDLASGDLTNAGTAANCTFAITVINQSSYEASASNCTEGILIPRLAGGGIYDLAGNLNVQTDSPAVTIDRTGPTATFNLLDFSDTGILSTDNITYATSLSFEATFAEAVTDFASNDLSNTGDATGCVFTVGSPAGYVYPISVTGCSAGTLIVHTALAAFMDAAGNPNPAMSGPTVTIDLTAPAVAFDLLPGSDAGPLNTDNITNATTLSFEAAFTEPVSLVEPGDFMNFGNAVGCSIGVGAATANTYPITVSGCLEGTFILRISAGTVTDVAGNPIVLTDGPTVTLDRAIPTLTLDLQAASDAGSSNTDNLTNATTLVFDATFSEAVSVFDATDLANAGTATSCTYIVGALTAGKYPVTANGCSIGTVILRVAAGRVMDTAGNLNAQTDSPVITIDRTVPSVSMSSAASDPTGTTPIPVNVTFSEAVTLFVATDIIPGNGTVGEFTPNSATSYSFNLYPGSLGTVTADIPAGAAQDAAGNGNSASLQFSREYDSIAPAVTITSTALPSTRFSPIPVTVTFSKIVTGFTLTDIVITNGTSTLLSGSGDTYTLNITPGGQGTVSVDIDAGVAQDSAGNWNTAAATLSRIYDTVAPTVTFDLLDGSDTGNSTSDNLTNADLLDFTAAFSEQITGLVPGDLTNAGTATGCAFTVGTATVNTYPVSASGCAAGTLILRMALNGVQDAAGNQILQADGPVITIDRTPATVIFDLQNASDSGLLNSDDITNVAAPIIDAIFNDAVYGLAATDFSNAGTAGVCSITVGSQSGNTYPLTFSGCSDGTIIPRVATGQVSDAAGNFTIQTDGPSITIDRLSPSPTLTSTTGDPTGNASVPVTVTFNEVVNGFEAGDIVTGNATTNTFTGTGSSYSFNLVASTQGLFTASIPAAAAQDTAGNANTASAVFSRTFDSDMPTASMTSSVTDPTNAPSIPVTVTFSEPVSGFISTDMVVVNAMVNNFSGAGANYSFDLLPLAQGPVTVDLPAGVATDASGNGNAAMTTFSRNYDILGPTVLFDLRSGSDSGSSYTDNITKYTSLIFDAIFDESVTGLEAGDLTNTGTATGCGISLGTATNNVFPVTLSTCSAGTVVLRLVAGTVSDAATNPNLQADGPTVTIDTTKPNLTWAEPTASGGTTITYNQVVHLEVNPTDSEGVDKVAFSWWDGTNTQSIGIANSTPYSFEFDTRILNTEHNQINAVVYDTAGNYFWDPVLSIIWLYDVPALSVTKTGSGQGTVVSNPAGINCGSACLYGWNEPNKVVTLTATPSGDSIFVGWSGACTGKDTCQVTMGSDKNVTAVFVASNWIYLPLIIR